MSIKTKARVWGGCLLLFAIADAWPQIEEVVVTTRRRAENLQDVPLAVSALTAEQIERQGLRGLADITKLDPSVQFDTSFGPQDTRITVRGLSNTRGRSNVAFLVDGIDVTTENSITAGSGLLANKRLLNDVERIEVVKGPQSALFGRAAFAGAISYVTKDPGDEFEGVLKADFGDYGRRQVDAAVGGPVIDGVLGLRATGVYWDQDGYYQNSVSGNDVGGGDGFGTALTALFTPADSIRIKARVEYSEDEYNAPPTVRINGDTPVVYPQQALDAGVGISSAFSGTVTNLPDFGVYCPGLLPLTPTTDEVRSVFPDHPLIPDPDNPGQMIAAPAFCIPKSFGSGGGKTVAQNEDPLTGQDYPGDTVDVLRAALIASWDIGNLTLSSTTGYTSADFTQAFDNDYQAVGRPDALISTIFADTQQETTQLSQELRLATNWEGPVQVTVGGLYWKEERDVVDRSAIISCEPVTKDFGGNLLTDIPGICDGTGGSVSGWQEFARQNLRPDVPGFIGPVWRADTEHYSAYFSLDWELAERFTLTLENRYVDEEFDTIRPNQASCPALGFAAVGGGFKAPLLAGPDVQCLAWDNAIRKNAAGLDPNFDILTPGMQGADWALIQGSESSQFNTPKITLKWQATDDVMVYTYWARAQKPGGIGQLEAGASATTIENERFAPEQMEAYEVGTKTAWEAAGALQVNGAFFFLDYSDKQTTTQVLIDNALAPRVTNASAAEVWGLEFDMTWQPAFVEGLTLSGAYTWLDATYVDFADDTSVLVRIGATQNCQVIYKGAAGPNPGNFLDPANGGPTCRIDQSGKRLERTPEHAFAGLASMQRPFPRQNFDWLLELNATYQGERFIDADNFTKWDDYWLLDLRAGLSGDTWEFIFYVDNLTNDDTLKTGGAGPDFGSQATDLGFVAGLGVQHTFGNLPDPRVFGVRFNLQF